MRLRTIKPGFFDNELLGTISPLAHLFFAGLWCYADHEGRMEYRPLRMKSKIFPYRDADIEALCDELEECGFICRYEIDGCRFLSVNEFLKHQRPHPNERKNPSVIPPCPVNGHTKVRPSTHQGMSIDTPNRVGSGIRDPGSSGSSVPPEGRTENGTGPDEEVVVWLNGRKYSLQAVKQKIVDVYNESIADHPSWKKCSKIPSGENLKLLEARAKESDWVLSFRRQMELAVKLNWLKNRTLTNMIRPDRQRQILDGEWSPGDTASAGQEEKSYNWADEQQRKMLEQLKEEIG